MALICKDLYLLGVEHLHIDVRRSTSGKNENYKEDWLELIHAFHGTKWLHITGERSTDIVLALQDPQMWHDIALPALCKLCIREAEPRYAPLRDALESFIYLRQLSGHIVAVEYERLWTNELLGTGTVFVR